MISIFSPEFAAITATFSLPQKETPYPQADILHFSLLEAPGN